MPLPKPREGESQEDWISRCMSNETMQEDFEDREQRLAVCYSIWRRENKSMEPKEFKVNLKTLKIKDEGIVQAIFATLNVEDHDGDVIHASECHGSFPPIGSGRGRLGEPGHLADDTPFLGRHGLHREAGIPHQHH